MSIKKGMTMTQQEMENIITELETTFKQSVNEKPWKTDGLAFGRNVQESANYQTKQFETHYGVTLWFNNQIVVAISDASQWEAFKSVARLFCQQDNVKDNFREAIADELGL